MLRSIYTWKVSLVKKQATATMAQFALAPWSMPQQIGLFKFFVASPKEQRQLKPLSLLLAISRWYFPNVNTAFKKFYSVQKILVRSFFNRLWLKLVTKNQYMIKCTCLGSLVNAKTNRIIYIFAASLN
jgi:hypothetical protein